MIRNAAFLATFFLFGCAAARTSDVLVGDAVDARASAPNREILAPVTTVESGAAETPAPATEPALEAALPRVPQEESLHSSRFTVKGGYWGSTEDALDDGYIFNLSWMQFTSKIFAVELEVGYMDVEGDDQGVDAEVWSVPIMLNGRVNVPIWILDVYGGLGIGTYYYDVELSGAASGDDDGFIFGGDAFVGGTMNIADRIALGLELKYYLSEDIDDADEGLNAYALMLTLGWSR